MKHILLITMLATAIFAKSQDTIVTKERIICFNGYEFLETRILDNKNKLIYTNTVQNFDNFDKPKLCSNMN